MFVSRFLVPISVLVYSLKILADEPAENIFEQAKNYTVKVKTSVSIPFGDDTKGTWTGAGFIVDAKRHWAVTNAHVASHSKAIIQASSFGTEMVSAKQIYVDPYFDIAVIEIPELQGLKEAPLECEKIPQTGVPVGAFGHPEGFNYTGTKGIVSGRTSDISLFGDYLQTDAPINPGNSGGPLISLKTGKIIGMNTAGKTQSQNMNFAIPSNEICMIVDLLQRGIDPTPPKFPFEFYKDNENKNTLRVASITTAGRGIDIRVGDEIIAVGKNKAPVSNESEMLNALRGQVTEAIFTVKRGNNHMTVRGKLSPTSPVLKEKGLYLSGILIKENQNPDIKMLVGKDNPMVIDFLESGSQAESKGFSKTDTVVAIDGKDFKTIEEAYSLVREAQKNHRPVSIRVKHLAFTANHMFSYLERTLEVQDLRWVVLEDPNHISQIAEVNRY